jgi:hypothetical protein
VGGGGRMPSKSRLLSLLPQPSPPSLSPHRHDGRAARRMAASDMKAAFFWVVEKTRVSVSIFLSLSLSSPPPPPPLRLERESARGPLSHPHPRPCARVGDSSHPAQPPFPPTARLVFSSDACPRVPRARRPPRRGAGERRACVTRGRGGGGNRGARDWGRGLFGWWFLDRRFRPAVPARPRCPRCPRRRARAARGSDPKHNQNIKYL